MLVCRKIFSAFYPTTLYESFSIAMVLLFCKNLIFSILNQYFMIGNIFVQSWLADLNNLLFWFQEIKQWMWRMFLPKSFQKCRSSRLQMFFRSSRPEMFCKKAVLRDFLKFTTKHLCQSLFITKVAGQDGNFILKKRPCFLEFPVNFANLEELLFLRNISGGCFQFFKIDILKNFSIFTREYLC